MDKKLVMCIRNSVFEASLVIGKTYEVLPDANGESMRWLRIVDESGESYLYPEDYFAPKL